MSLCLVEPACNSKMQATATEHFFNGLGYLLDVYFCVAVFHVNLRENIYFKFQWLMAYMGYNILKSIDRKDLFTRHI